MSATSTKRQYAKAREPGTRKGSSIALAVQVLRRHGPLTLRGIAQHTGYNIDHVRHYVGPALLKQGHALIARWEPTPKGGIGKLFALGFGPVLPKPPARPGHELRREYRARVRAAKPCQPRITHETRLLALLARHDALRVREIATRLGIHLGHARTVCNLVIARGLAHVEEWAPGRGAGKGWARLVAHGPGLNARRPKAAKAKTSSKAAPARAWPGRRELPLAQATEAAAA